MATVVLTITNTASAQLGKITATVADAEINRIIAMAIATFPNQYDNLGVLIPKTSASVLTQWGQQIISDITAKVVTYEATLASATAIAAVAKPVVVIS